MAIYFGTTEITGIDNLVPQSGLDITDIWFGATNVYTVWEVYEGTLPATFNASGDDMRTYQIFGNTWGVGDRTVQLYDWRTDTQYKYISNTGVIYQASDLNFVSDKLPVEPGKTYQLTKPIVAYSTGLYAAFYDDANNALVTYALSINQNYSFEAPSGATYFRTSLKRNQSKNTQTMFTEGSTSPASYVPFGYEVDISTSDGASTTTTPIYIGDTALQKDEYIDYKEQKVYRMSGGVLTPTDPPVALPPLPTVDGTTIVDYAGSGTTPEKVLLKYRKEGY